ncbi:MAG TPA: TRAP transporter large permease subunit [Alphaproteobacteria bacterium]|jgi:tripartite ATP-independent transporter DctM subunit|nr:TRAP transporter large permease subunit [Alphaproteobacteria bacterium]
MTDLQISFAGLTVLLLLLLMRVPVGVALGGVSFVGIWVLLGGDIAWGVLTAVPYDFVAHWTLSSIPMFLLMGYVCYHTQLTDGLFKLARLWLSALPGGLGVATVGAAAGFSAVTGSSLACAAAMGRIAVPEMLKSGYDKGLSAGCVAAAGTIGSLIPPSIILLLFGIFAEIPISKLFIAGVIPGLLSAIAYSAVIIGRATRNPEVAPRMDLDTTWSDRFAAVGEAWPVIALVIGVFGGLFAGIFTPTEAGAIGAFLSFVISAIRGKLTRENIRLSIVETLSSTASIFVIAIGANLLTRFLALAGFTDYLAFFVADNEVGPLTLILGITVVYLLLGMFLDPIGIMLLTLPIFLPLVENAQIDLIWFGILMTKYLEIALITPPVGLNVFVIKGIVGDIMRTETIFRGILWFIAADLVVVALLIAFPQLSLFLPGFVK